MALPPIGLMTKIILTYAAPGIAEIINRVFFKGTTNPTPAGLNTACQTISNNWVTYMAPQATTGLKLIGVEAEDLSSPTAATGIWTGSQAGTVPASSGQSVPQLAFVIREVAANRYRGGHGRVYIPGVIANDTSTSDANTWNTTFATTMTNAWANFLLAIQAALNTNGCGSTTPAIPHYIKGGTWVNVGTPTAPDWKFKPTYQQPPVPFDVYLPNAISYNPNLGTQRRRAMPS